MFPSFKARLINYTLMLIVIFGISMIQSTFWPFVFSSYIPLYLWLPFLVYWALYRGAWETLFMTYFLTFAIASTSTISPSHFLLIHSLFFLALITVKKFYYINRMFFGISCVISFLLFPILLWTLSIIENNSSFTPAIISWILGGIVSWLLAWPLLYLLKSLDNKTISSTQGIL